MGVESPGSCSLESRPRDATGMRRAGAAGGRHHLNRNNHLSSYCLFKSSSLWGRSFSGHTGWHIYNSEGPTVVGDSKWVTSFLLLWQLRTCLSCPQVEQTPSRRSFDSGSDRPRATEVVGNRRVSKACLVHFEVITGIQSNKLYITVTQDILKADSSPVGKIWFSSLLFRQDPYKVIG